MLSGAAPLANPPGRRAKKSARQKSKASPATKGNAAAQAPQSPAVPAGPEVPVPSPNNPHAAVTEGCGGAWWRVEVVGSIGRSLWSIGLDPHFISFTCRHKHPSTLQLPYLFHLFRCPPTGLCAARLRHQHLHGHESRDPPRLTRFIPKCPKASDILVLRTDISAFAALSNRVFPVSAAAVGAAAGHPAPAAKYYTAAAVGERIATGGCGGSSVVRYTPPQTPLVK